MIKIGSVVQLKQGDTESCWVVCSLQDDVVEVVHEDELGCKPMLAPVGIFHQAEINHRDKVLLLHAFSATKRGKEIVAALTS